MSKLGEKVLNLTKKINTVNMILDKLLPLSFFVFLSVLLSFSLILLDKKLVPVIYFINTIGVFWAVSIFVLYFLNKWYVKKERELKGLSDDKADIAIEIFAPHTIEQIMIGCDMCGESFYVEEEKYEKIISCPFCLEREGIHGAYSYIGVPTMREVENVKTSLKINGDSS